LFQDRPALGYIRKGGNLCCHGAGSFLPLKAESSKTLVARGEVGYRSQAARQLDASVNFRHALRLHGFVKPDPDMALGYPPECLPQPVETRPQKRSSGFTQLLK